MAGIYLHIPFCKQACYYCDFHFSTNLEAKDELISAMVKEIRLQRSYLQDTIHTIYFGGGTPSLLSFEDFDALLNEIYANFEVHPTAEITVEANPDDLSHEKLLMLRDLGINRLSIGIQSFDDNVLKYLNRAHDSVAAVGCMELARDLGFNNISIDLIYAIPIQDDNGWSNNIRKALALEPEHISAYSLTVEEKTVFGRWHEKGAFHPASDETAARQLEMLISELEQAGYEQYEVSNFAKTGFYSRHNSSYWMEECYLGVGPSAHSYNRTSRQFNIRNNHEYIRTLKNDIIPFTKEILTHEDKINDYLLTRLRTSWGIDLKKMKEEFGYNLMEFHNPYIITLLDKGLAVIQNDHLVLTKSGRFLADKISSDLFMVTSA